MGNERFKVIMRTSIVGIAVNVMLATFKMIIGQLTSSIAILMDGVNNLSDAGSSLITILGATFAGKQADKKHPFGYGRIEYLSTLVISGLVLYAGITSLIESISSIIHPEVSEYSTLSLIIIGVAIIVKLSLALFTQKMGKKANSDSLVASGKDALFDVAISTTTLVAAIIFVFTGFSLEAYLAAVISLVIIKSGIEFLRDTVSKLIGEPEDIELAKAVKKTITSFDGVYGAYDLVMNNYGPDNYMASVHMEVDDTLTVAELDVLTRKVTETVHKEYGVGLTAIGIYSRNTLDKEAAAVEADIRKIVKTQEHVNALHGFYLDKVNKAMRFDLVISFNAKDRRAVFDNTLKMVQEAYPDYKITSSMDVDYNELGK